MENSILPNTDIKNVKALLHLWLKSVSMLYFAFMETYECKISIKCVVVLTARDT